MGIATRAGKTITWTFDPTVSPEHDIIRERVMLDGSGGVWSGSTVTVDKALGFVPVMAAVRVISETIASLPLQVFERLPEGKRLAPEHRLYGMLHDSPNPEMSSMVYREVMQSHIESWGNAYSEIEYDTDGFPLHLWPLRPDQMTVLRDNGRLVYLYRTPDGREQRLSRDQIFHIPGLGYDGRVGYSPIHMARKGLALGMAAEEFAGRFYDNDARPGLAIKLGAEFDYDDEAKKRLAESFDATHAGLGNKHRTAVLDEGMGLETFGFPADDAQLIEQQKWSIPTVSRVFNLSPHMLHDLERATFSNIEEQGINVTTYQFRPRTIRWDQQIKLQLMRDDTRHFAEHNLDGLLKGKLSERMQAYWQMYQMSAINPDEIRAKENLNPLPDGLGETYYYPQNLGIVSSGGGVDLAQQAEIAGVLIRAGFDPDSVSRVIGLTVQHTGDLPITTRPVEEELPPLQAVRSAKSVTDRKRVAEKYRPLFEKLTAQMVEYEREQVLAEAERRFAA